MVLRNRLNFRAIGIALALCAGTLTALSANERTAQAGAELDAHEGGQGVDAPHRTPGLDVLLLR